MCEIEKDISPPLSAQQANLVGHLTLFQEGRVGCLVPLDPRVLCCSHVHHAVCESQSEAQLGEHVRVSLLQIHKVNLTST